MGIGLVILVICLLPATVITIASASFWLWFEQQTGIEAYGHSGPADWCYLLTYALLVMGAGVWSWGGVKRRDNSLPTFDHEAD